MTAPDDYRMKDQTRDVHVVRCVGCGAWTDNHWACTACDDAIHPTLCPWILRGFPRCVCNAAESQCLALGYYKGLISATRATALEAIELGLDQLGMYE